MKYLFFFFALIFSASVSAQSWSEIAQKNIEAATNGDVGAAYEVGVAFWQGRGVEKNVPMALYWLKISAQKGDTRARDLLTRISEMGYAVDSTESTKAGRYLGTDLSGGSKVLLSEGTFSTHIEKGAQIQGMPACNIRFTAVGGVNDPRYESSYLIAGSLLFIKVTEGGKTGEAYAIKLSYKKNFEKSFHAPTYLEVESHFGKVAVARLQVNATKDSLLMAGPYDDAMNDVMTGIVFDQKFKVGFKTPDSDLIYSTIIDIDVVDTEKNGQTEKQIRNRSNLEALIDCLDKR